VSKLLLRLEARLGAILLRLLKASLRWEVRGQNPLTQRCIYFLWHRDLLILGMQRIDSGVAVMVSSSKDGELIAGPIKHLGYVAVRGSSTRQGSSALKEMIRLSRTHTLAITPDGPKGPVETIRPGVFEIALLGKVPIIAVACEAKHEWVFNSWDRFRIPKPFSRIKVQYSQPFYLESRDLIQDTEKQIRAFIKETQTLLQGEFKP
jgi:hypothetical protein